MNKQQVLKIASLKLKDVLQNWEVLSNDSNYGNGWGGIRESSSEVLARSFIAAVPLIINGGSDIGAFYRAQIVQFASDKKYSPQYRKYDQLTVEVAGICACLLMLEHNNTDIMQHDNSVMVNWVSQFASAKFFNNNWQLFAVIIKQWVNKHSSTTLPTNEHWDVINSCYVGNGMYSDGVDGEIDYYNHWGFHWYSMVLVNTDNNLINRNVLIDRSITFASELINKLSTGPLAVTGRSQCYREAASAVLALINEHKPIHNGHLLLEKNYNQWENSNKFSNVKKDFYSCNASEMWRFKWLWQGLIPENSSWWGNDIIKETK